jgi:DNA-binding HxlR family transcriptional regulator
MNTQVILYILNMLTYDAAGSGGVGRTELAKWFGCSKNTIVSTLQELVKGGLIREFRESSAHGNGWRFSYRLTEKGYNLHLENEALASSQFHAWQNQKMIALLQEQRRIGKKTGKALKVTGGQKTLW